MKPDPRAEPESGMPMPMGGANPPRMKVPHLPPPPKSPVLPQGPAQTIIALATLIGAMGGGATLRDMFAPSATKEDVAALRAEIKTATDGIARVELALKESEAERVKQREQLAYVASWACAENAGKLGPNFDLCDLHTWEPPPAGHSTPTRRTFTPWPK